MYFFTQNFILLFFLIRIFNGLIFFKKCNNYVYTLSKVYHNNYFLKTAYQQYKNDHYDRYYDDYWHHLNCECKIFNNNDDISSFNSINAINKPFPNSNTQHCNLNEVSEKKYILSQKICELSSIEYLCANSNNPNYVADIVFLKSANFEETNLININYKRSDSNNGTSNITFNGGTYTLTDTAYKTYDNVILNFSQNQYNSGYHCPITIKVTFEVCPYFCDINCEFYLKYCNSSKTIEDIIRNHIQQELYPLESHFGSTIIDKTNNHYYIYQMDFNIFKFPHNEYLTEFCPKVLHQKYSPIKYFVIFHNLNDTSNSIIIKDNREILDYKKYCQNYSIISKITKHTMNKTNDINFSHYFLKYGKVEEEEEEEPNEIMNNTITYESLRGKLEFKEKGDNYKKLDLYDMKDIITFVRDGIYYSQILKFQYAYGSLYFPYEDELLGTFIYDIYPFYCDISHKYENRTCWTTYSLNGIKNEIQTTIIDLHEHVDERIIGNGFIVDIFDNNSLNIQTYSDSKFPLRNCKDVYSTIDNNIQNIIIIQIEDNNEIYYEIYNGDPNNHTKLNVDYCIYHNISNIKYQINDIDVFEFNLNDLISPKLIDSNIYDYFTLTFTSDFKGIIEEENFSTNTINQINAENEIIRTKSRKYFYHPSRGYYSFSFSFELLHNNQMSYEMKGNIIISVFPLYCYKKNSTINEKKCITNYNLDFIKNYILNDETGYDIHLEEYIINSLYNLTSIEVNSHDNPKCDSILKKFYGNDKYFVLIINEDQKGEIKELYNTQVVPYEKINEDLCNQVYNFKIDKIINYNSLIDIYEIIKDILPKNYESNFFQIKIYTEEEYKQKTLRRLNSIEENNLVIKYIPDKFKYYNTKYYFEIEKDNIFLNIKGEINFKVYPYYCEDYNVNRNCSSKKTLEEIINYINVEDIDNFEEHVNEIIYNEDYIFQIEKINSNFISNKFDFKLCEKEIRETYFLNENEKIYLETIENKKTNTFSFHIFNSKGFEYNSSFCSSFTLKNINTLNLYDVSNYEKLINSGYDIFNISSPFYNDLCISYSFNGNDITIKDRKKKIFPRNICYKNCDYKLFDNEINCECKINSNNQIFELNTNGLNIEFDNKTYFINYKFAKCSNLFFKKSIVKIFGFWFMLLIIIIQIFVIFHYLYISENSLYNLVEVLNIEISKNIIIKVNEKNILNKLKDNENGDSSLRKIFSNQKENNSIEYEIRYHSLNSLVSNLDYFTYYDSLKKDTRSYFSMLISLIKEKTLFIRAIYKHSLFELQSINFFIFLLYISFILSFNVLFFSENYISEKFINNNISTHSFTKIIFFSSLFNMFLIKFILLFNNYSIILNKVIYEFHGNRNFKFIALKNLDIQKFKIRIFLFINLIISFGLFYFVSTFCALYQKTQFYLFIGTIFSICFSYGIFLFLCIIISIMRFISLNKKFEYLYYFSFYLRTFL